MSASVSLVSDPIIHVATLPFLASPLQEVWLTNSVLAGIVVSLLLLALVLVVRPSFGIIPSKMQLVFEMTIGTFYNSLKDAYGSEARARKYLPYIVTLFLFYFLCNQFALIPLINDIVASGDSPVKLFRTPTSDWSLPLVMALITVVGAQIIAFITHPLRHIGNYIRVTQFFTVRSPMDLMFAVIEFLLGFLEIISEFAKVISLSARLFGNVFAGEMMVLIVAGLIAGITTYIVPMPFIILSVFSGVIQAFVFAVLSLQFMAVTIQSARGEAH